MILLYLALCLFTTSLFAQQFYTTTLAGKGKSYLSAIDGFRTEATFKYPNGLYYDSTTASFYVADTVSHVIRVIDKSGFVTTFAGTGTKGISNGARLTAATFDYPYDLTMDAARNIYVVERDMNCIRKIDSTLVSTFAGTCTTVDPNPSQDGTGSSASFGAPASIHFNKITGLLYVSDIDGPKIRIISPASANVTTLAGNGKQGSANGIGTAATFNEPRRLTSDLNGDIYVADTKNSMIRKIELSSKQVSTYATGFREPWGLVFGSNMTLYVADRFFSVISQVAGPNQQPVIVAGNSVDGDSNGVGAKSEFWSPSAMAADENGTLYVADIGNSNIRAIYLPSKIERTKFWYNDSWECSISGSFCVETFAGNGYFSRLAPGSPTNVSINGPFGSAIHPQNGKVFMNEQLGGYIKVYDPVSGLVSVYAGDGVSGLVNGAKSQARFGAVSDIVIRDNGDIMVSDYNNSLIRMINSSSETVTNYAGPSTLMSGPAGLFLHADGRLFIADRVKHNILVVYLNRTVAVYAGSGSSGLVNNANPLLSKFSDPVDIVFDSLGNAYVSDRGNFLIRLISPNGAVSTLAGSVKGIADGPPGTAKFSSPFGLAIDQYDNIYVSEDDADVIRMIRNTTKYVSTMAGTGLDGTQNGPASKARFSNPKFLAVNRDGSLFFVPDFDSHRVRIMCLNKCLNGGIIDCVSRTCSCPDPWIGDICSVNASLTSTAVTTGSRSSSSVSTYGSTVLSQSSSSVSTLSSEASMLTLSTVIASSDPSTSISSDTSTLSSETSAAGFESLETTLSSADLASSSSSIGPGSLAKTSADSSTMVSIASEQTIWSTVSKTSEAAYGAGEDYTLLIVSASIGGLVCISLAILCYNLRSRQKRHKISIKSNSMGIIHSSKNHLIMQPDFGRSANLQVPKQESFSLPTSSSFFASNFIPTTTTTTINQDNMSALALPGYKMLQIGVDFVIHEDAKVIGSGGFADLLTATICQPALVQRLGYQDVAVKKYREPLSESMQKSVVYEICILSSIPRSPFVVDFIGYAQIPNNCILMKRYVCSLGHLIKTMPADSMTSERAFKIAHDLSRGMALVHSKNIVHLDLKPGNILLDQVGVDRYNFVVCDFGAAQALGGGGRNVRGIETPQLMALTLKYNPPEVFRRMVMKREYRTLDEPDKKIDVYSYAITMFEVMTQSSAWHNWGREEVIKSVINFGRPEFPAPKGDDMLGQKLIDLVQECWDDEPNRRPSFDLINSSLSPLSV